MATAKEVLILGGGFGGLMSANLIRKNLSQKECQITVIDKNQYFMMGLVNLWILSGSRRLEDSQVALNKLEAKGIKFFNDESCFNVYDAKQVPRLREKLLSMKSGRVVVCIADIPYKCPPAPYEVSLLINDILVKNGTRDSIDLNMYVPTQIALPVAGPKMSQDVVKLLNNNHINFHPLHKLKKISDKKTVEFENGNKTS